MRTVWDSRCVAAEAYVVLVILGVGYRIFRGRVQTHCLSHSHQPPVVRFPGRAPVPWCPSPGELPPPSPLGARPRAAGRPLAPWLLSPRARAASCLCIQSNPGLTRAHARPSPLTVTLQRYSQGRGVGLPIPVVSGKQNE